MPATVPIEHWCGKELTAALSLCHTAHVHELTEISLPDNARVVEVAPGIVATSPCLGSFEHPSGAHIDVTVEAVPAAGGSVGRFIVSKLTFSSPGQPIDRELLRSLPLTTMANQVGPRYVRAVVGDRTIATSGVTPPDEVMLGGPSDEALAWVAFAYRLALVVGEPPTQAVARTLIRPPSTAARWVQLARKRGFLGPSEGPGKRGG
jgi:hypothetical protein